MRNVTNWIKQILRFASYITFIIVVTFVTLEIIFRFLPVSTSKYLQPVNQENPISHFKKNHLVIINEKPDFSNVRHKQINNWGYFSDYNYQSDRILSKCRSIVIGDSYVEAIQVKNKEAFNSILHEKGCETFAFGKSGDPLSQYLAYAEFVITEFNPDNLIFSIIANDFDESLIKYKNTPANHYFNDNGELLRVDFMPSLIGLFIRGSSFLYYLYNDVKIQVLINRILWKSTAHEMDYNEFLNARLEDRESDSRFAIDLFMEKISEFATERQVFLVVDADRNRIYQGYRNRDENKAVGRLNNYFIQKARRYDNVVIVDMQKYFWKDWMENRTIFNSDQDYHWNAYGHFVVANTIQCYLIGDICGSNN